MKKRYIQYSIFICFMLLYSSTLVFAQKESQGNSVTIESLVKDAKGNPIKGAVIYGNEGKVVVKTDVSGKFSIIVPEKTDLLIECDGYEPAIFRSGEYEKLKVFSLKQSLYLLGDNDDVNIAFGKVKMKNLANAVSVINPDEILKYDNVQGITEALSGRVPGLLYGQNIRGYATGMTTTSAMYIVDGLPRDINTINLSEVEQITVLKDLNSSVLYGNGAVNGVIQIKTKRGEAFKNKVNVQGYYGINKPSALPQYLNSSDYMRLYNEAKVNDGLQALYTDAQIAAYTNENPYRYPSVDYYSKPWLKDYKTFSRVTTELSGGNNVATYYSNIGWEQNGSLLNFGAGDKGKQNKFNIRGNVDMKINSWIKTSLDAVAVLNSNKGSVNNPLKTGDVGTTYWTSAATLQPYLFAPLIPISSVVKNDPTVKARKNDVYGQYLLGGTSTYLTNPIADGYSGGENENIQRTLSFNNRVDFDLRGLAKGLAFHTNISFDYFTRYDQTIGNQYSVYIPNWRPIVDSIASFQPKLGTDARSGSQNINNPYYERRFGFYGMLDYNRSFGLHQISGALTGYGYKYKVLNDFQGNKNANLGLRFAYSYNNKYMLDFSSNYVNSVKLPKGKNQAFSPTLGLAWVVAADDYASSASIINYLKVRASAGIMNSDMGIDNAGVSGFYYYDNSYTANGSFAWNEGAWSNYGETSIHTANPNLGFEKRKDINLGLSAVMLDHQLTLDGNVFYSEYYDQIVQARTQYPSFYYSSSNSSFIPYTNFESNSYQGVELGLSYKLKIGDFSCIIGANGLYADSKILKKDEIYADKYQYRKGTPIDGRWGLVSEGFFMNQTDINDHAFQAFGAVKPGDIKYKDQNKDGIVDANDQVMIGRWQAPWSYGLNVKIAFKNLTLFARGNGSMGSDGYLTDNSITNSNGGGASLPYYWVDGNDKYSTFVLNRWTPATATTATYPRLSSVANPNNFQSSTFWLYKDNYFTVDRVQLTYDFAEKAISKLGMKNLSLFANASNLITFSKFKAYRELKVGSEPNYRSFSLGIKTMF